MRSSGSRRSRAERTARRSRSACCSRRVCRRRAGRRPGWRRGMPASSRRSVWRPRASLPPAEDLLHAMQMDKKFRGGMRFVLLEDVGRPVVVSSVPEDLLARPWRRWPTVTATKRRCPGTERGRSARPVPVRAEPRCARHARARSLRVADARGDHERGRRARLATGPRDRVAADRPRGRARRVAPRRRGGGLGIGRDQPRSPHSLLVRPAGRDRGVRPSDRSRFT